MAASVWFLVLFVLTVADKTASNDMSFELLSHNRKSQSHKTSIHQLFSSGDTCTKSGHNPAKANERFNVLGNSKHCTGKQRKTYMKIKNRTAFSSLTYMLNSILDSIFSPENTHKEMKEKNKQSGAVNRSHTSKTLSVNVSEKTPKCIRRHPPELRPEVLNVNSTQLLDMLNDTAGGNCIVVMFYAPWCMFSARAAPYYNALARAFPRLWVVAVDAAQFSSLNARFGTVAVPTIIFFSDAKAIARFNQSERSFENFVKFVRNVSALEPEAGATVLKSDYDGPLSSVPTSDRDLLLWFSWIFVVLFTLALFVKSRRGQRIGEFIKRLGQNQDQHHVHID